MPQISFIVSSYDRPESLELLAKSLKLQTLRDMEVIVIDRAINKSIADFHYDICQELDGYFNCIYRNIKSPNKYHSCEQGAELANGDWLCFPSDDSYYVPQFTERMVACGEFAKADFVYCDLVHGHHDVHNFLSCNPRVGQIDKTNFIIRRDKMLPFAMKDSNYELADGYFVESIVKSGAKLVKLPQLLVVHN